MLKDIYDPLTEYINVFHDRFRDVCGTTFSELADEAHIDVEANQATCRKVYATQEKLLNVKTRIGRWTFCSGLLWAGILAAVILSIVRHEELGQGIYLLILFAVAALFFLFLLVHPRIKKLKNDRRTLSDTLAKFKDEAWKQMSPLNRLYDWDILTRMMSATVPKLEFDPYFTTQRLADLEMTYGWDGSFNKDRSVIYSHSGLINGNPFVICRTRKMEMGTRTYYGSKTIYWTTQERDADGRYRTVQHSETLTASVTAPYPEYPEKTRLIYGNTAAPDLIFYRRKSGLAGKEGSLSYKWNRRALRKKARDLSNADFAMMTNEEFEVAFNTSDRNDNGQFALLFTPLAQESMLKLLKDKKVGFGDDFDFEKRKMINTIVPQHMQQLNLDMDPRQYRSFDYNKAKQNFYAINSHCFRAIYFSLAPLLCIPMYQQIRPYQDIYGLDMKRHSAFWEHEALANFWGQEHFRHPSCVTDCILKTDQRENRDDSSVISVQAYGYRSMQRLTYISRWGGDGRSHNVPVYWDEYLPVTGSGEMHIQEDNDLKDTDMSQRQRLDHINSVLDRSDLDLYRRHIASGLN